jgi:hypothetical protein
MLSEGITEVIKEASKGKELEDILKEMALNEILKNTRLSARGKEVTYDMNPNLSIYNNPMETGIRFEKRFADGGIASAIGEIQNRKDGSGAMGEGGIGNLLTGEGGLLFDTSSPGTMAADAGILALTVFPPAAIAARLIQAGYKGSKLTKAMNQVKKIQESIPKGLGLKGSGRGSTFMQLTIPKEIAGVANMADGGAAEKEEDKDKAGTYKKETIIKDIINILSNTPKAIAKVISPDISKDAVIPSVPDVVKDVIKSRYVNEVSNVENKPEEVVNQIEEGRPITEEIVYGEVNDRFKFLKDMDPALARALIAGGSAMLRPTEGPVRSFLSLGEFGGAFADSLSKSDAAKTDIERLYATTVAQIPEGEKIPTFGEFIATYQNQGSGNLTFAELSQSIPAILASLQIKFGKEDVELSDFAVQRGQDKDGKDIFVPLNIAIQDVSTDDDIRKLIKDSVLNPNAKKEKSGGFLSTLFGD